MMQPDSSPETEFSVIADLHRLSGGRKTFNLSAGLQERAAISARLSVREVERLEGDVTLKVTKTHIKASGVLRAALIRECVASLEDMTEEIDEAFEIEFLRASAASSSGPSQEEEDILDAPEIHEGEAFDLGELLTQQLSLAMAAFPRKAEADNLAEKYGEDKPVSPFAALAKDL